MFLNSKKLKVLKASELEEWVGQNETTEVGVILPLPFPYDRKEKRAICELYLVRGFIEGRDHLKGVRLRDVKRDLEKPSLGEVAYTTTNYWWRREIRENPERFLNNFPLVPPHIISEFEREEKIYLTPEDVEDSYWKKNVEIWRKLEEKGALKYYNFVAMSLQYEMPPRETKPVHTLGLGIEEYLVPEISQDPPSLSLVIYQIVNDQHKNQNTKELTSPSISSGF